MNADKTKLRALIVEDSLDDVVLIERELCHGGFDLVYECVETAPAMRDALATRTWDIVLADFMLPGFGAPQALSILKESGQDIPFIIVSGTIIEETAVEMMLAGVSDYLTKDSLKRLTPAVLRECHEADVRRQRRDAEIELRDRELQLRTVTDNVPALIARVDTEKRYRFANDAYRRLLGIPVDKIIGRTLLEVLGPETYSKISQFVDIALSGEKCSYQVAANLPNAGVRYLEGSYVPEFAPDGTVLGFVLSALDTTVRCQAEQALRGSEERLRLALESGRLGIWDYDLKARTYVEISDQCKYNLGLPQTGTPTRAQLQQMIHPEDLARVKSAMQAVPAMLSDYHEEYRVIWPNGEVHWISARGSTICDASGQPIHVIGTTHDITDRKRVEEQKERDLQVAVMRADQDPLTELLNHRAFQKRLEQEANKAQAQGTNLAVVMLDLDNFKFFNDAYGHTVGDDVLRLVASRLQSLTGPNDTVARFGGDEFALLLPDVGTASRKDIERNVRDGMEDLTYLPEGQMAAIPVGICLGIALYPYENLDWHEIVSRADERLRRAKTSGISENEADQVRMSMHNAIEGFSMLDALVTAVDNKDRYTRRHSEDVLTYSLMIARELGFSETEQQTVAVSALLHDVGKIGIPDAILRKPSSLTDTEYGAIKQHPEMGAIMVASVQGLEDTLDAVRHHHERWDGCGYPGGLKGAETPIMARLMAVADAFSAMTTDRPYRKGMNVHNAFLILNSGAGTQWDAECVQAFVRAHNGETDTEAA